MQCGAVINPFAQVDLHSRRWRCALCGAWSALPAALASATAMPVELRPEHATIEYELPAASGAAPSS
eukprot:926962-Prymnesium_polylepis.1